MPALIWVGTMPVDVRTRYPRHELERGRPATRPIMVLKRMDLKVRGNKAPPIDAAPFPGPPSDLPRQPLFYSSPQAKRHPIRA